MCRVSTVGGCVFHPTDEYVFIDLVWGATVCFLGAITVLGLTRVCYTISVISDVPLEDIAPIPPLPIILVILELVCLFLCYFYIAFSINCCVFFADKDPFRYLDLQC